GGVQRAVAGDDVAGVARGQNECGGRDRRGVGPRDVAEAVTGTRGGGYDGLVGEIAANVGREIGGGSVPPLRILLQRAQGDPLQLALEISGEGARLGGPRGGCGVERGGGGGGGGPGAGAARAPRAWRGGTGRLLAG